jgi:hypothetical protein
LGNSRNFNDDTPFFTSDYPVAIDVVGLNTPINRVVPLAPDLAVRVKPDIRLTRAPDDLTFAKFRSTRRALKRYEVVNLNRSIVQCAENLVFYCGDWWWMDKFLKKNRHHYIEPVSLKAQHGTAQVLMPSQRIGVRADKS